MKANHWRFSCGFAVLLVSDNYEFLCTHGHKLLLCLTPASSLDAIELLVDFISTINGHIELEQPIRRR